MFLSVVCKSCSQSENSKHVFVRGNTAPGIQKSFVVVQANFELWCALCQAQVKRTRLISDFNDFSCSGAPNVNFRKISQVAQARNKSIGIVNLRKWKDINKKQLTLLKMCVTSFLCGPRADLWPFYGFFI